MTGPQTVVQPAKRPKPDSVRGRILAALIAGRSLTSLDAWREFGGSRLAADIHALRGMGFAIISAETPVECREGRTARVASYFMVGGNVSA